MYIVHGNIKTMAERDFADGYLEIRDGKIAALGDIGDARLHRVPKCCVHGIDGINGTQIRRDGIHVLIAVVPLHPLLLLRDSHMTVRLDNPRHHQTSRHVKDLSPLMPSIPWTQHFGTRCRRASPPP